MKLDSQDEIQTFLCYGKSAAFQCCVVVKSSYWPLDGNSYIGRKSLKQNKIQNTSNKVNHIKFTDTFCYIHVHLTLKQSDFGNMKQKKSRTHAPEIQSCECKSNSPITNMKPNHSPHSPNHPPSVLPSAPSLTDYQERAFCHFSHAEWKFFFRFQSTVFIKTHESKGGIASSLSKTPLRGYNIIGKGEGGRKKKLGLLCGCSGFRSECQRI